MSNPDGDPPTETVEEPSIKNLYKLCLGISGDVTSTKNDIREMKKSNRIHYKKVENLEVQVNNLNNIVGKLQKELNALKKGEKDLELVIFGLEVNDTQEDNLQQFVYQKLLLASNEFSPDCIKSAKRIGKQYEPRPKPVLVSFTSTTYKALVFKNIKQLREHKKNMAII